MLFQWLKPIENPLVRPFYQAHLPYSRPNKADCIAVLRHQQAIVACARLRPIGEFTLLTGMLVDPQYRGQGLGHQLLQQMHSHFKPGYTFAFALPALENFYLQHGFSLVSTAPNDIQQRYVAYQQQGKELRLLGYRGIDLAPLQTDYLYNDCDIR